MALDAGGRFAPLEYGDPEAAQLRVYGRLTEGGASHCWLKVDRVEELRNGERRPPLTEEQVYSACGPSLLTAMEAFWSGDMQLGVKWDRNNDWVVAFRKDSDDGWERED